MFRVSWTSGVVTFLLTIALSGLPSMVPVATAEGGRGRGGFEPPVLEDVNRHPKIVEVHLEASIDQVQFADGSSTEVWTYNGGIPGPTIKGRVGDTLIVHFTNNLPEPTTIHWHGMEVPANMDGSNIAQHAVPPGGYFRYEFKLLAAATYWYHPHIRTNVQIEKGLYGMIIVRDPEENRRHKLPRRDLVVVLDDVLLDASGEIAEAFPDDPAERAAVMLNGREGNVLLVNGKEGRVINVPIGVPQRWRIANVANARFMRLSIPGHTLYRIGGDGGLLEHPITIPEIPQIDNPAFENGQNSEFEEPASMSDPDPAKGLLLSVAERADIVFTPRGKPGDLIPVEWHDWARGLHETFYKADGTIGFEDSPEDGKRPPETLMYLRLVPSPWMFRTADYTPRANLRHIKPIDTTGADPLKVTFGHMPPDQDGNVIFFAQMNDGMGIPFKDVTAKLAQDVTVGETRVWEITNLTGGDHPFHAHGWFFQPIEIQYIDMDNPDNNYTLPWPYLEWKDTLRIPKRPGAMMRSRTIVRAAVHFTDEGREGQVVATKKEPTDEDSGGWVFHCHINEHADMGMMSFFEVFE